MRRRYRYGIFIASAILACAPLAMNNNVVKADVVGKSAQSNNTNGGQKGTAGEANGTKDNQQPSTASSGKGGSSHGEGQQSHDSDDKGSGSQENGQPSPASGDKNSGLQNGGQQGSASGDEHVAQAGDTAETAYTITYEYDPYMLAHTKIKVTKDLTVNDVDEYFRKYSRVIINGKANPFPDLNIQTKNQNGQKIHRLKNGLPKDLSLSLKKGYTFSATVIASGTLLPNKWYKWQINRNSLRYYDPIEDVEQKYGSIPTDILARIHWDKDTDTIALKTDDKGGFPTLEGDSYFHNGKDHTIYTFGRNEIAPAITFTASDDSDAISIPHDPRVVGKPYNYVDTTPVVPGSDNKGDQSADKDIPDSTDSNSSSEDNTTENDDTNFEFSSASSTDVKNTIKEAKESDKTTDQLATNNTNSSVSTDKNNSLSKDVDNLIFIHNAYIYRKDGKLVSKRGAYRYKSLYSKAKILDGGRTTFVKIRTGKKVKVYECYRIGKNEYVKIANVGKAPKPQKVNTRGTIKTSSKYGIKLYNSKGKFTKKILTKTKKVRFDQKKFMLGAVFYRIKGTNAWVRKGNIKF